MKQVIVNIPDSKYSYFLEMLKELGIDAIDEMDVPEAHKTIVRDRIKNTKPDEYVSWEEVRDRLKLG